MEPCPFPSIFPFPFSLFLYCPFPLPLPFPSFPFLFSLPVSGIFSPDPAREFGERCKLPSGFDTQFLVHSELKITLPIIALLDKFSDNHVDIVIRTGPATYRYGVSQRSDDMVSSGSRMCRYGTRTPFDTVPLQSLAATSTVGCFAEEARFRSAISKVRYSEHTDIPTLNPKLRALEL